MRESKSKESDKVRGGENPPENRGGARENAGRPVGSGKYKSATITKRIPLPLLETVEMLIAGWMARKNGEKK